MMKSWSSKLIKARYDIKKEMKVTQDKRGLNKCLSFNGIVMDRIKMAVEDNLQEHREMNDLSPVNLKI
jgi:hypothetical protein